jgi:hypothetical protein
MKIAAPIAKGSYGRLLTRMLFSSRVDTSTQHEAKGAQDCAVAQHQTDYLPILGAKGAPDADFTTPLRDHRRRDGIHANRREHEADHGARSAVA